jgi:hypothetical protein
MSLNALRRSAWIVLPVVSVEEKSGAVHGQRPLIVLPRLRRLLSDCRSRFGRRSRLDVRLW